MNSPEQPAFRVPDEIIQRWKELATKTRVHRAALSRIGDPLPGSALATDDSRYALEQCSDWVLSHLQAAVEHFTLWADLVAPADFVDGHVVKQDPRPSFTIARASLESAAQALWILHPESSEDRVNRHLRLMHADIKEFTKALSADQTADERAMRERLQRMEEGLDPGQLVEVRKGSPGYLDFIRDMAPAIGHDPNSLEVVWRGCSAAAHGKNWFQHHAYRAHPREEFKPGQFRTELEPDAEVLTGSLEAAMGMVDSALWKFVTRSGHDQARVFEQSLIEVVRTTRYVSGTNPEEVLRSLGLKGG